MNVLRRARRQAPNLGREPRSDTFVAAVQADPLAPTDSQLAAAATSSGQIPTTGMLLAVGLPKGLILPPAGSGREPTAWVRAGGRGCPLLPAEFDTWALALIPNRPQELVRLARSFGVENAAEVVGTLEDVGLLLRVEPTTDGASLGDVRVIPTAFGAGNDPDRRNVWRVTDLVRETTLELDPVSYGLWQEFDGATSITEAATEVMRSFPAIKDEAVILARVPSLLLVLMAARYVFVDREVKHAAFA